MTVVSVCKRTARGEVVLEYAGEVLERGAHHICVEAFFMFDDRDAGYVVYKRGDRFVEWHYSDRWYNVFQLYDRDDGRFKGWYCNISRPAVIEADRVCSDDLALDVFVSPSGDALILDEDEFGALDLSDEERRAARQAVESIRRAVRLREPPFNSA